ncbi:MAG TPA: tRNA pseudouridine(55) synthase TruB [Polyangiales bacterium]|nr:tRNA pseudouridine(55) synthase TruB [Polyangiales bacterium]
MTHGLLVVDKPRGVSSHDVVRLARRAYRTRAVGHGGTLDPMATGVLLLGIGEATKLLHHLSGVDKTYLATVTLGAITDSLDADGVVIATAPIPLELSVARIQRVAARFIGEQIQRAPVISAIKRGGVPLYERARRGEVVEEPERQVTVHGLDILSLERDAIELRVHCASGFYVRSLARDLAAALGSVGHLSALRRETSGAFSLCDAVDSARLTGSDGPPALLPPAAALRGRPCLTMNALGEVEVGYGRALFPQHLRDAVLPGAGIEPVGLLDAQGRLRALGRAEADRIVMTRGLNLD